MWVDQSESWFPAKHAHVRRHQTQHILCQQRLSYLRSTSNYFLVVAWFFYFFIEKADFFSKIQTFWRKRRPYLCVFFKKVLFADQSPLKRTQLVSLQSEGPGFWAPARFGSATLVYEVNHGRITYKVDGRAAPTSYPWWKCLLQKLFTLFSFIIKAYSLFGKLFFSPVFWAPRYLKNHILGSFWEYEYPHLKNIIISNYFHFDGFPPNQLVKE